MYCCLLLIHRRLASVAVALLGLIAASSYALSPEQVFAKAAPSIVVVKVFGANKSPAALGSGIVVGTHEVVTNCHVLSSGTITRVTVGGKSHDARVIASDVARDLCLLNAPQLAGRPAELRSVKNVAPGARVFAIGAPQGLELTISEGLASGLRSVAGGTLIQTSAAIAPGSSGGGLFDDNGRLIGITSFVLRDSQNIGFALPSDWIGELSASNDAMAASVRGALAANLARADFDGIETHAWVRAMQPRLRDRFPDEEKARRFLAITHYESLRAGLDPNLTLAMVAVLSNFRTSYVSPAGARGLMQVMPAWLQRIGSPDHNLFHERTNLRYGCTIFRYYLDKHEGDVVKALTAYFDQASNRPEGFSAQDQTFSRQVMAALRTKWALSAP